MVCPKNEALLRVLVASVLMLTASTAAAQGYSIAPNPHRAAAARGDGVRIAAVIEGNGDRAFGAKVRALIEKYLAVPVVDLAKVQSRDQQPDIVVSVAAANLKEIHVLYWDRTGLTDLLSAPASGGRASAGLVAASLAVAVVRKHLEALNSTPRGLAVRGRTQGPWVNPSELRRFFSQLVPVRHRTEGLSEADF